jgi:hypothetical protein
MVKKDENDWQYMKYASNPAVQGTLHDKAAQRP